jgi:hypothetical protein
MRHAAIASFLLTTALLATAGAQTPQPFPRPGESSRPQPSSRPPAVPEQAPPGRPPATAPSPAAPAGEQPPSEATLGVTVYPGAEFIASYDASRGQRYYLFGTNISFAEIVAYYRTLLKQRGDLTYEQPPIHMFELGRFREETMAFPPSVTVKDYTWGGSEGYLNPKPGGQPPRFRTIIQIVPAPPVTGGAGR